MKTYFTSLIFLSFLLTACSDSMPKNTNDSSSKTTSSALSETTKSSDVAVLQCLIDGKSFKGKAAFNACLFYPNGYENKVPKNSLTMTFPDTEKESDLQVTITILPFDKKAGVKSSNMIEALYTGTIQGKSSMFGYKQSYKNANFSLELTKVEDKGATLILSGKFAGKFTSPFTPPNQESPVILIKNGEFSNIEIKVVQ